MAPDLAGLQEVLFGDHGQDDLLANAVQPPRPYRSFPAESDRWPGFGNAILCAIGEVLVHERLSLGRGRVAVRVLVLLPQNRTLWFATTHLHHRPAEPAVRLEQAETLLAWLDAAPAADAIVLTGDFNTPPHEPTYARMGAAGYRSAMVEANGAEPPVTWPSGIQAPTMDTDGDPACLDYIWLRGQVSVLEARVAADQPAAEDPTLYPSDHFALCARLLLG